MLCYRISGSESFEHANENDSTVQENEVDQIKYLKALLSQKDERVKYMQELLVSLRDQINLQKKVNNIDNGNSSKLPAETPISQSSRNKSQKTTTFTDKENKSVTQMGKYDSGNALMTNALNCSVHHPNLNLTYANIASTSKSKQTTNSDVDKKVKPDSNEIHYVKEQRPYMKYGKKEDKKENLTWKKILQNRRLKK